MVRKETIQSEGPPSAWATLSPHNWKWLDDVRLLLQGREGRQNFINTLTDAKTNNANIRPLLINTPQGDAKWTANNGSEPYVGPNGSFVVPGAITAGSISALGGDASVSVYQALSQTIANSLPTVIIFDSLNFDAGSTMNLATGKWTPTQAGIYRVTGSIGFEATNVYADKYVSLGVAKNGVTVKSTKIHSSVSADIVVEANGLIEMNGTTDYVEVAVEHNFGFATPTWAAGYATYFDANKVI